jgi:predicted porin
MTKNILAIAIAAAVMAPSAFAAATVYGTAAVAANSFSSVSNVGNTAGAAGSASTGLTSISSNTSILGIKGSEDLGAGMKAVYQMEFGVALDGNSDAGAAASTGLNSTRNSFVGLGGGFGTVLAGRHDSLIKMTGRKYDMFGDVVGNNRNILGGYTNTGVAGIPNGNTDLVDGRHNNVLAYISPTWSGFHFGLAYVPSSAAAGAETLDSANPKMGAITALADYTVGNFSTTLGYIGVDNAGAGAAGSYKAYRLGAGYTFGNAKVVGLYQTGNSMALTDSTRDTYGIGGSYKVGAAGTIKAQYYTAGNTNAANDTTGGTLTTVGYDHALSKTTTAYAVYASAHNNATGTWSVDTANSGAGSNVSAVTGKDNSALSVGLIHKF